MPLSWTVQLSSSLYCLTLCFELLPIYTVRTTTPVHVRNRIMKENKSYFKEIPTEMEYYNRTNVCTHCGHRGLTSAQDEQAAKLRSMHVFARLGHPGKLSSRNKKPFTITTSVTTPTSSITKLVR
ncbi:hypothetical protein PHMEG_00023048 [Phytophthora megakarya]|uniref:Uncharacterized protein n=1 Tax=Phytophthora megakarya TaxID=4795 RepID=A0A225VIM0_9STRA|nr:hypothetical protein PHMEG_00023048 [Phytophthora megakarya]